jgi:hypothetical protein
MGIEQTIPVTLLRSDVAYFVEMAREQGETVPELLRSILEAVAEDDREAESESRTPDNMIQLLAE